MNRIKKPERGGLGQQPIIHFIIDDSAHCKHTFQGTLCNNVNDCGKIHIQRCTAGVNCTKYPRCSYLHEMDMVDSNARENFKYTMQRYNAIKNKSRNNKQVNY